MIKKIKDGLPVILCVGSDKIAGDSIGPYVGELLKNYFNLRCFVYGAIGQTVNGQNLNLYIDTIKKVHPNSPIIAVDACVSNINREGEVVIKNEGVTPGRAVNRNKNIIGDVGVLAVVAKLSNKPLSTLLSVSIDKVEKICFKVAFIIYSAFSL